nr:hypothetical protein [uncultured Chitinophaga sp.]
MNKSKKPNIPNQSKFNPPRNNQLPIATSLLDVMEDENEYVSLLKYRFDQINIDELRRALQEVVTASGRYTICYLANSINTKIKENISIMANDDLPFTEMINVIPPEIVDIDIILATPGGSAEQVQKFVDKLRPRFQTVNFIIPDAAMSSGTIWAMSGNEIVMTKNSYIGPIDPQIPNREGRYVPAQSILAFLEDIRVRGNEALSQGRQPNWLDLQLLHRIDHKDIGAAHLGSRYSIELVKTYLANYKFSTWNHHSNGVPVADNEKEQRALEIATKLCDSAVWKSHARGITREVAWSLCQIKIKHSETIPNFDRAIRRFWAAIYWFFDNSAVYKMFISHQYALMRQDISLMHKTQ